MRATITIVYHIDGSKDDDDVYNVLINLLQHAKDSQTCNIGVLDESLSDWHIEDEDDDELKPCPFCGNEVELEPFGPSDRYHVECMHCGVQGAHASRETAIMLWNRRAKE